MYILTISILKKAEKNVFFYIYTYVLCVLFLINNILILRIGFLIIDSHTSRRCHMILVDSPNVEKYQKILPALSCTYVGISIQSAFILTKLYELFSNTDLLVLKKSDDSSE